MRNFTFQRVLRLTSRLMSTERQKTTKRRFPGDKSTAREDVTASKLSKNTDLSIRPVAVGGIALRSTGSTPSALTSHISQAQKYSEMADNITHLGEVDKSPNDTRNYR